MEPIVLLARLHREGLQLRADGEHLLVCPGSKITPELRTLIQGHKRALLDLIQGQPSVAELDLLVAVFDTVAVDEITVRPIGPRSIGPCARCPRHPRSSTWTSIGGRPACRLCELGVAVEPPPSAEPPRLAAWFVRHCQRRGLSSSPRRIRPVVSLAEQVEAALRNGPKSARQIALELDVPLAEVRVVLGDRGLAETDGLLRMTAFPERDELGDRCEACGEYLGPDPISTRCGACRFRT
jgi:hypothetical protein